MYAEINGHMVAFFVDEKNRTCGASIGFCKDDVQKQLLETTGMSIYFQSVDERTRESIQLPETMKAIARCAPEDEFSAEIGMQIAYKRLRKRYWEKYAKRMEAAVELLTAPLKALRMRGELAALIGASLDPLDVLSLAGNVRRYRLEGCKVESSLRGRAVDIVYVGKSDTLLAYVDGVVVGRFQEDAKELLREEGCQARIASVELDDAGKYVVYVDVTA